MQLKKTERANLENKKTTFFLIGMVIVLASLWSAFEYRNYDPIEKKQEEKAKDLIPEEEIVNTQRNEPPPPPPPPDNNTVIEVVDDEIEVEDIDIDIEADEEDVIEESEYVEVVEDLVEEEEIFQFVEDQPEFPGGEAAMQQFIIDNVVYPEMARELGLQGTVFIKFVLEKNGKVSNVQVLRGGFSEECDAEAVRVVKMMPKWSPGKQRGKAVRAYFTLPVRFVLQG